MNKISSFSSFSFVLFNFVCFLREKQKDDNLSALERKVLRYIGLPQFSGQVAGCAITEVISKFKSDDIGAVR